MATLPQKDDSGKPSCIITPKSKSFFICQTMHHCVNDNVQSKLTNILSSVSSVIHSLQINTRALNIYL